MRKFRKLLAVLLTVVLTFGNSVSVFAGEIDLPVETETVEAEFGEAEFGEAESEEEFLESETLETQEVNEEEATDEAGEVLPDEEEIPLEIQSEEGLDVIAETAEETEESENEEIIDEEIEGSYPGVALAGFCEDSEIIEDKEELSESLDDIEDCVPGLDYVEGEIIVAAPDEETAEIYAEGFGGTLGAYLDGFCLIVLDTDDEDGDGYSLTVADAVAASADLDVALPAAYPNYIGKCASDDIMPEETVLEETIPEGLIEYTCIDDTAGCSSIYSDPYLKGTSSTFQYQHSLMQSEAAWRQGYTGKGIKVAVIDTGARSSHEDLNLAGMGKYNSSTHSFETTTSLTDEQGHGTHCLGIVGAIAGNSKGGAGIAPGASLYAAKSYVGDQFDDWGLYEAMIYAVNNWKVDIMSISLYTYYPEPNIEHAVTNAYEKGTVVFVASGNDSNNRITYPACCKYAVPVGAVDEGNTKIFFSNQTSKVRYSGPGYHIWSTFNESNSSYVAMNGTSMACPAVAGAAAVILSSGKVTGSGSKKVDNLLALMDKGATKSGIGKGTPNIAKSIGISNYAAGVDAPTASIKSGTKIAKSKETVTFSSASGTKLYFNTTGGNMSYKNGVVSNYDSVAGNKVNLTMTAPAGGKVTLKVMAVDETTGLASKVSSFTYTFTKVVKVDITSKNPDFIVAKGSSLQLGTTIYPATAANKAVTWSLASPVSGVSIDQKGKLIVDKSASASSVTVRATAQDGSELYGTKTITITGGNQIKAVSVASKNISIYTESTGVVIASATDINGQTVSPQSACKVSTSNTNIATASLVGNNIKITGGTTPGKATITCYSSDGSFKKAAITVNVLQKVTGAEMLLPKKLVQGGTFNQKVTVQPSNASNKKLVWSLSYWPSTTTQKACGVTVNSGSGQIKVSAKAVTGLYTVMCKAADNRGYTTSFSFNVVDASSKIKKLSLSTNNITLFRVPNNKGAINSKGVIVTISGGDVSNVEVSDISAPGLVEASIVSGTVTIKATGKGTGDAKVTVSTTDGTNLKQVIKVKVVNPPSNLILSLPADRTEVLGYGASMKLVPTFYTDYGPIDASSKKLEWTSNNPYYMTVSSNGTVKSVCKGANPDIIVTITAKATDGSGLSASIQLRPNRRIVKITEGIHYPTTYYNDCAESGSSLYIYIYNADGTNYGVNTPISYTVSGPENGCYIYFYENDPCEPVVIMRKKGNYTVTYRMNDGTNKKVTCRYNCKYNYY